MTSRYSSRPMPTMPLLPRPAHPVVADVVPGCCSPRRNALYSGGSLTSNSPRPPNSSRCPRIAVAVSGRKWLWMISLSESAGNPPAPPAAPRPSTGTSRPRRPGPPRRADVAGGARRPAVVPGDPHLHESVERFLRRAVVCHCHILLVGIGMPLTLRPAEGAARRRLSGVPADPPPNLGTFLC